MAEKELPIGIQDFAMLIQGNYLDGIVFHPDTSVPTFMRNPAVSRDLGEVSGLVPALA